MPSPILAVTALGLSVRGDLSYTLLDYSIDAHLGSALLPSILSVVEEVAIALGLIVVFFLILQATFLHLPRKKLIQIAVGILYTFVGLVIFLSAVTVGFMPVGYALGTMLAKLPSPWLIGIAFSLPVDGVVGLAENLPAAPSTNEQ